MIYREQRWTLRKAGGRYEIGALGRQAVEAACFKYGLLIALIRRHSFGRKPYYVVVPRNVAEQAYADGCRYLDYDKLDDEGNPTTTL